MLILSFLEKIIIVLYIHYFIFQYNDILISFKKLKRMKIKHENIMLKEDKPNTIHFEYDV